MSELSPETSRPPVRKGVSELVMMERRPELEL